MASEVVHFHARVTPARPRGQATQFRTSAKRSDTFLDVWKKVKETYDTMYPDRELKSTSFRLLQDTRGSDIPFSEPVDGFFGDLPVDQRVLSILPDAIDDESTDAPSSLSQPSSHKRARPEELTEDQQPGFKRRKTQDKGKGRLRDVLDAVEQSTHLQDDATGGAADDERLNRSRSRFDRDGFVVPPHPQRAQNARTEQSPQNGVLNPNSQPQHGSKKQQTSVASLLQRSSKSILQAQSTASHSSIQAQAAAPLGKCLASGFRPGPQRLSFPSSLPTPDSIESGGMESDAPTSALHNHSSEAPVSDRSRRFRRLAESEQNVAVQDPIEDDEVIGGADDGDDVMAGPSSSQRPRTQECIAPDAVRNGAEPTSSSQPVSVGSNDNIMTDVTAPTNTPPLVTPNNALATMNNSQSTNPSGSLGHSQWSIEEDRVILRAKRTKQTVPDAIRQSGLRRTDSAARNRMLYLEGTYHEGRVSRSSQHWEEGADQIQRAAPSSTPRAVKWTIPQVAQVRRAVAAGLDFKEIQERYFPKRSTESIKKKIQRVMDSVVKIEKELVSYPKDDIEVPAWTDVLCFKLRRAYKEEHMTDQEAYERWFRKISKVNFDKKMAAYRLQMSNVDQEADAIARANHEEDQETGENADSAIQVDSDAEEDEEEDENHDSSSEAGDAEPTNGPADEPVDEQAAESNPIDLRSNRPSEGSMSESDFDSSPPEPVIAKRKPSPEVIIRREEQSAAKKAQLRFNEDGTLVSAQPIPSNSQRSRSGGVLSQTTLSFRPSQSKKAPRMSAQSVPPRKSAHSALLSTTEQDQTHGQQQESNEVIAETVVDEIGDVGDQKHEALDLDESEQVNSQLLSELDNSQPTQSQEPVVVSESPRHGRPGKLPQRNGYASQFKERVQRELEEMQERAKEYSQKAQALPQSPLRVMAVTRLPRGAVSAESSTQSQSQSQVEHRPVGIVHEWIPYEQRPVGADGKIDVGRPGFPHRMFPDHPWVMTDDELWRETRRDGKPEWQDELFEYRKIANMLLLAMTADDEEERARLYGKQCRLRRERRRKMGLPPFGKVDIHLWRIMGRLPPGFEDEEEIVPDDAKIDNDEDELDVELMKKGSLPPQEHLLKMAEKRFDSDSESSDSDSESDGGDYGTLPNGVVREIEEVEDDDDVGLPMLPPPEQFADPAGPTDAELQELVQSGEFDVDDDDSVYAIPSRPGTARRHSPEVQQTRPDAATINEYQLVMSLDGTDERSSVGDITQDLNDESFQADDNAFLTDSMLPPDTQALDSEGEDFGAEESTKEDKKRKHGDDGADDELLESSPRKKAKNTVEEDESPQEEQNEDLHDIQSEDQDAQLLTSDTLLGHGLDGAIEEQPQLDRAAMPPPTFIPQHPSNAQLIMSDESVRSSSIADSTTTSTSASHLRLRKDGSVRSKRAARNARRKEKRRSLRELGMHSDEPEPSSSLGEITVVVPATQSQNVEERRPSSSPISDAVTAPEALNLDTLMALETQQVMDSIETTSRPASPEPPVSSSELPTVSQIAETQSTASARGGPLSFLGNLFNWRRNIPAPPVFKEREPTPVVKLPYDEDEDSASEMSE